MQISKITSLIKEYNVTIDISIAMQAFDLLIKSTL